MPELPEVETVVRGLRGDVTGRTFTGFKTSWARQLNLPPDRFADRIRGQQVKRLWRRAKYIVFDLDQDVLLIHLKMTGRLYVAQPNEIYEADRWLRQQFTLDNGHELRFSDSRKFGRLILTARLEDITGQLGPEPLSDAFTIERFRQRLSNRKGIIKSLLLNQQFIAGVGNIYADEALWLSRIDPRRKADTLKDNEINALHAAIRQVLQKGIEREGASINWYRKPDGTSGSQQNYFNVYGQEDEPCPRCGQAIIKIRIGQRGTHLCSTCQK